MTTEAVSVSCPECRSKNVYRDGLRYTASGQVQRWLCRSCGYRFTESGQKLDVAGKGSKTLNSGPNHLNGIVSKRKFTLKKTSDSLPFSIGEDIGAHRVSITAKQLNTFPFYNRNRQICVSDKEAKNLAATETKTVAGEGKTNIAETKGLLVKFAAWLDSQGYKGNTYFNNLQVLVNRGADLRNPENVKSVIARLKQENGEPWCDTTKMMMRYAYAAFVKMEGITWIPPRYKQREVEPFIPEESELDALIASCKSKRMATYLQSLKETYGDPTEVLRLRWIDITNNVITIAQPVKNHLSRQLEVSQKLLSMLGNLPKSSERIFPTTYACMENCFVRLRKRTAFNLQNPRLLKISLGSFRHWGGTMIAYYTNGNVLTVKKLLGHRRVENTMKYIGRIQFKNDRFEIATATTEDEIKELGASGYEKYDEHNGVHFYRKPKRFKV